MKRCPQCDRVERDDALKFCRFDGTALVNDSSAIEAEAGTVQLGSPDASELHTSILPHRTDANVDRATGPTTALHQQSTIQQPSKAPSRKARIALAASILIAIAVGVYFVAGKILSAKKTTSIESVAVLPFENKSGTADSEYLSDGLAESLIYRLSQLSSLKVSPRSSAFRYKGQPIDAEKIGYELGVDAVMSGRLIQRGDDLVISVDLVDVRNKKTIWGERFERKMSDLVGTQREIAEAIADKLQLRLSGDESRGIKKQYTSNNEAYQLIFRAVTSGTSAHREI